MGILSPTITRYPGTARGGGPVAPPNGGGGDHRNGGGSPNFGDRLRRARLGLAVGLTPIIMLFVSFTSAYIVRQGLSTWNERVGAYASDWLPVSLPTLLLG